MLLLFAGLGLTVNSFAANDSLVFRKIADNIMLHGQAYEHLRVLCKTIGHRLSGSPQAQKAVSWAQNALRQAGADTVWLQPVDVPVWTRGPEQLTMKGGLDKEWEQLSMLSLGNSEGTKGKVLEAPVVMVSSFDAFKALRSEQTQGAIIFFNFPFPQEVINTFDGYGIAGPYRWHGPNVASAKGAAGVVIRSVSTGLDDFAHTGSIRYADSVKPIPAVAIGNTSADKLARACAKGTVRVRLQSDCGMHGVAHSYNVIGEIRGTDFPQQIVLVGGHLDSWDVGEGAHDDGAGCVQAIEVIRTFKATGIRPKRTTRAVLFMNEENGLKGGHAYADSAKAHVEQHILAIESDAGGFSPRGIGLNMPESSKTKIKKYQSLFLPYGVYDFDQEEGGADISPLQKAGIPVAGLLPDPQRYFDLHHTQNDVFEQVNHRELKLGAVTLAQFVYLISEYGL